MTDEDDPGRRKRGALIHSLRVAVLHMDAELARIDTLGNEDAIFALDNLSLRLLREAQRLQALRNEFADLEAAEFEAFDDACEGAQ